MTETLAKIQKLLALSESPNEAEAASALAKAHSLLEKHNLSMEDIVQKQDKEVPGMYLFSQGEHPAWYNALINNLADLNYCAIVKVQSKNGDTYTIIGKRINSLAACNMIDYLASTVVRIAKEKNETSEAFYEGMTYSIIRRLYDMMHPSTEANALMLYTKKENDDLIRKIFGNNVQGKKDPTNIDDGGAYFRGYIEGKKVHLNEQITE